MNLSEINWLGTLLGALAGFVLGALWYGPVFGKIWMTQVGITREDAKKVNMGVMMGSSGLTYIVTAIIIAILLNKTPICGTNGHCWMQGLQIGAMVGIAAGAAILNNSLYEMKSTKLKLINVTYSILNGAVIGAVIGAF